MKINIKSLYASLSKNDYVETFADTIIGAIAGYILPIIYGTAAFNGLWYQIQ